MNLIVQSIAPQDVRLVATHQDLDAATLQDEGEVGIDDLRHIQDREVGLDRQRGRGGEVERVPARVEGVLNDGFGPPRAVGIKRVHLVAGPAVQRVVARTAGQHVVEVVADQRVVAVAAHRVLHRIQKDQGKVCVHHLAGGAHQGEV